MVNELPPIFERTVPAVLASQALRHGSKPAVTDGAVTFTYVGLAAAARRLAGGLHALGVGRGDPVAVLLDNHADFAVVWAALGGAGMVQVPINTAYRGDVLVHLLADSGATVVICEDHYLERVNAVVDQVPALRQVVVRGDGTTGAPKAATAVHAFEDLCAAPERAFEPVAPSDPVAIMYTSGTTGRSKGVVVAHAHAYTYGAPQVLGCADVDDIEMVVLPLFHVGGQWAGLYNAIIAGATAYISPGFRSTTFWDEVRANRCTYVLLVAAMAQFINTQPPRDDDRTSPLRRAFVAPVITDTAAFAERFGLEIATGYGSTEAGTVLTAGFGGARPRACGWPAPGVEVRVVDAADGDVTPGQVGELLVRRHEPWTMMVAYHGRPDATVEAWRNLWYHTGDAVFADADGQYVFVDRTGDAIRRRGENIASGDVEDAVNRHPDVVESAAVAVPGDVEHEVLAVVVCRPGADLPGAPERLVTFLVEHLPHFMVPRYIRFVDELERTPTGKVRKQAMRQSGVTADTWDREAAGIIVRRDGIATRAEVAS